MRCLDCTAPRWPALLPQNNLADITAKGESVANLADILGTVAGIVGVGWNEGITWDLQPYTRSGLLFLPPVFAIPFVEIAISSGHPVYCCLLPPTACGPCPWCACCPT